jgi:hypothetical protein
MVVSSYEEKRMEPQQQPSPEPKKEATREELLYRVALLEREVLTLRRVAHNAGIVAQQERSLRRWRPKTQKKLDRLERKRA